MRRLLLKIFLKVCWIPGGNDVRMSFESIYSVTFHFEKRQKTVLSGQMSRPYGNERAASL